jgi:hypothetical protein
MPRTTSGQGPVRANFEKITAQIDQRGSTLDYQELEETVGMIIYWLYRRVDL